MAVFPPLLIVSVHVDTPVPCGVPGEPFLHQQDAQMQTCIRAGLRLEPKCFHYSKKQTNGGAHLSLYLFNFSSFFFWRGCSWQVALIKLAAASWWLWGVSGWWAVVWRIHNIDYDVP